MFRSRVPLCKPKQFSQAASTLERNVTNERRLFGARWYYWSCVLILILSTAGCDRDSYLRPLGYDRASLLKRYTPQDDESLAIHCVDLLLQSQFEDIENQLDPSIKSSETRDALSRIAYMFPSKPISTKTVDASVLRSRDSSTTSITLEYEFARTWLLAQVAIRTRDGVRTISGFHVTPISGPLEIVNGFTFTDKGISQYTGMGSAVGVLAFTMFVFVLCIRTKMGKERWLWLIVILIGACRVTVNWTTGQWFFTPIAVQAPPVMMLATPYGPWLVQMAVPLGAVAFLLRRKRLLARVALSPIQLPNTAQ